MWTIADRTYTNRLIMGTSLFPSPGTLSEAIEAAGVELVTVAMSRPSRGQAADARIHDEILEMGVDVLPVTAGCRTVTEAVTAAGMARERFKTNWIKLEVIGDDHTLQPDTSAVVEAATELVRQGFEVLPHTTPDLVTARKLVSAGCRILLPGASWSGTAQGLADRSALEGLRARLPDTTLVIDGGIGRPSDAALVMETGFDGVLVHSAIALARDPVAMAEAFADAVSAGRIAHEAGLMIPRKPPLPGDLTPDTPFWHTRRG